MTNVLISAAGLCGATIIGAILGFFVKELPHKWNDAVLGYCAGIMLAASTLGLIVPAFEQTSLWWLVVIGVMAGALFLNVLDLVTPHLHHITGLDPEEHRNNARLSHVMLFVMAIALHKLPEGMAAGVSVCSAEGAKQEEDSKNKGTVSDLVIPIIMLIIFCMAGMVYSGGFFDADNANYLNFVDAFAASNASVGLVIGSLAALILTIMMFTIRKTLPFDEAMSSLIKGFEAMVPAILILTLAWTLKSMTDSLGAAEYVSSVVASSASELQMLLPGIIFLVAGFLAFATGTSWGTFGILIPICIAVFPGADPLRIISISACMAGAVCGDHISPISDTTIMASAGAECKHVHHVSSQLPYALTVACVSFFTFIVAGFTHTLGMVTSAIISWIFGVAILGFALFYLNKRQKVK